MPTYYRTFLRSARNWQQFSRGRKVTQEQGLTYEQAQERCREYNQNRTPRQIRRGTMMEFEAQ